MKITEQDLQNWIKNAENNNVCQQSLIAIKNCKTVQEVLEHKNAIEWSIWYVKNVLNGEFDFLKLILSCREKLKLNTEEEIRRVLFYTWYLPNSNNQLEKLILDSGSLYFGFYYIEHYLNKRWLEFENQIENRKSISEKDVKLLLKYTIKYRKEPWKKLEDWILDTKNTWSTYQYSKYILKNPWKEGEELIKLNSQASYCYSKYILKNPWKEGEEIIRKSFYYGKAYQEFCESIGK